MSDKPRILIGSPAFGGIVPKAQVPFLELAFWCGRYLPEYDFCFELVVKREQFRSRNLLISTAVTERCDYLLMLDDDMLPPPDLVKRLLAHDVPVCGALYWQRGGSYHPVIMREFVLAGDLRRFQFISPDDLMLTESPGLHAVDVIGGGCMLFKTAVFDKLLKPYFWWEAEFGTDITICHRLRDAGIPVHVDTSLEIPHVDEDGQVITRRTIPRYAQQIGAVKERYWHDVKAYFSMNEAEALDAMYEAKGREARKERWTAQPRDTWEQVRAYYQEGGTEAVLNLAYWNVTDDPARNYVLTEIDRVCPKGGTILDYGCGNGFLSVALAEMGYTVHAYDLEGTPTLEFCRWRVSQHGLKVHASAGWHTPVPEFPMGQEGCSDGALMISVIDHAFDPWGALQWITRQIKPGGFLILDHYNTSAHEDEPQHLCRFDALTFVRDFEKLGWKAQPESHYLFILEK